MTQDLRQAILALTNRAKALIETNTDGSPRAGDERLIENVLELMPAGPILETLWAALPVPTAVMSGREGDGYAVTAYYGDREQADRVHQILAKTKHDFCEELKAFAKEAEAASTKARLEREHALEKRLLAERDAFAEGAHDTIFRQTIHNELKDMADQQIVTPSVRDAIVAGAMDRITAASVAPIHPPAEEVADGDVRTEA